ncbi:dihydroxyacetone kinase subunit DhaL [Streptomyces sp. NPDC005728]|uniref:dihydroxyacetone kinase subunit DhaL n=1 Tax=Streptomyces sp. NPDC005728 TaxID=3157054 RepID=UPI0033DDA46B
MDIALAQAWVQAIAEAMGRHQDYLTQLDVAVGDADHGINVHRGFAVAVETLADLEAVTVGDVLIATGTALAAHAGGASGVLYGAAFRTLGTSLGSPKVDAGQFAVALAAGLASIQRLGAAVQGEKTMIDAYTPALAAFERKAWAGERFALAASAAAEAAEDGMTATTGMAARKGRPAFRSSLSIGQQDPGATSTALIFRALADTVMDR